MSHRSIDIETFVLGANKPQQLMGRFNSIQVLSGSYHTYYLYDKDPGSSAQVDKARPLHRDGQVMVGPFKDPWVVAIGQTAASTVRS